MKSPAAEWTLGIAYLGTLDLLRARRRAHRAVDAALVALAAGSVAFHRHIVNPLKEKP